MDLYSDSYFMQKALQEAQRAFEKGEVPIGALVVCENKIVGKGYNQVEQLQDSTAHAELLALTATFNYFGTKYADGQVLYVTVEPCLMCAGAIALSRISKLVIGCREPKTGYSGYKINPFPKNTEVVFGVEGNHASQLLKDFFQNKREKN